MPLTLLADSTDSKRTERRTILAVEAEKNLFASVKIDFYSKIPHE
jgi:hypothetical protein